MNRISEVHSGETESDLHFTYCASGSNDLQQGDILSKTPELASVLEEVHPHYLKDDYIRFIVLTQSCDLVRRKASPCRARYITLAAIRPLDLVVQREIGKCQQDEFSRVAMVCGGRMRSKLEQFLARLLNNNEPGYFYLHEAPEFGLSESSCAFLRLSISLKSALHYETCRQARILSLKDVFQAKLGWLVGNVYSRVGTEDWVPRYRTRSEFARHIRDILDCSCRWVNDEQLKAAKNSARTKGIDKELISAGQVAVREHIDKTLVPSRRERILERLSAVLAEVVPSVDKATLEGIQARLTSDAEFQTCTK